MKASRRMNCCVVAAGGWAIALAASSAHGQSTVADPEVDSASLDPNVVQLRKEDLVRWDNPAFKKTPDISRIIDPAPVIDKRNFRQVQPYPKVEDEAYVCFKPGISHERAQAVTAGHGGAILWRSAVVPGLYRVRLNDAVDKSINAYLDVDDVLYAEPNYIAQPGCLIPNDPMFGDLWGMRNADPGSSETCAAWNDHSFGSVVAIIDSGTLITHEDLTQNIWQNPGENPTPNGIDDDDNGYIDDINGWNAAGNNATVTSCGESHGTHVAGTVGARGGNFIGVIGAAPFVELMILRCNKPVVDCPSANGTDACCGLFNTVDAVDYAIANGARVSNNSYGTPESLTSEMMVIQGGQAFDHIFVAAAGNGGADSQGDNNDVSPFYPASYNLGNIISVAAIDWDGELTGFSNYGSTTVDLGAPGYRILSTVDDGGYEGDGLFNQWNGTSMAAPHVAGVAALITDKYPNMEWWKVTTRILQGTYPNPALNGLVSTDGQLYGFVPLGVWVQPGYNFYQRGSWAEPYHHNNTFTAYNLVPQYGTLNFKPGSITAADVNFTWNKYMTLDAPLGPIVLGN